MEALVAISVLSIVMVVILQLFSGGLRASKVSDDYTRGIFHAREIMEEMLLPYEFGEGMRQGDFDDGYRWRSEIVRQTPETEDEESLPFDTYLITVSVSWPTGEKERRFEISTLRLMEKEAE